MFGIVSWTHKTIIALNFQRFFEMFRNKFWEKYCLDRNMVFGMFGRYVVFGMI